MAQRTPRSFSAPRRPRTQSESKANVSPPTDLIAEGVREEFRDVVQTLKDLRSKLMLEVRDESMRNRKKGMHMAQRRLKAEDGLAAVKALPGDIRDRLQAEDPEAVTKERAIRNQVLAKDLQKYDDLVEKWLKMLTADEGLEALKAVSYDIKVRLNAGDSSAADKKKAIRARVLDEEADKFDRAVEAWLKTP